METRATSVGDPASRRANARSLLRNLAAAPFIYGLSGPLLALDAAASLYQAVCFRLWRIPQVSRSAMISLARHELTYLNGLQRLNCAYCSYANGVLAYGREIASRTEQYWCPIQQASPPPAPHNRYKDFIPYLDQVDLAERLSALRQDIQRLPAPTTACAPRQPDPRAAAPVTRAFRTGA